MISRVRYGQGDLRENSRKIVSSENASALAEFQERFAECNHCVAGNILLVANVRCFPLLAGNGHGPINATQHVKANMQDDMVTYTRRSWGKSS